jgi:hypothetical protein
MGECAINDAIHKARKVARAIVKSKAKTSIAVQNPDRFCFAVSKGTRKVARAVAKLLGHEAYLFSGSGARTNSSITVENT